MLESDITDDFLRIMLYIYMYIIFTIYSKHSMVWPRSFKCEVYSSSECEKTVNQNKRKLLTLNELLIGRFVIKWYLATLKQILYSIKFFSILSKHVYNKIRQETCLFVPKNILSVRDYTERLFAYLSLEFQSDYFWNGIRIPFSPVRL